MPMTNTPVFPQAIINPSVQILPADSTNYKNLRVGSSNGDRIDNIVVTSTDTVAKVLMFAINDGAIDHPIGEVAVPITAGTDGAAVNKHINALSIGNFPGLRDGSLYLQAGYVLKVRVTSAVSASRAIHVVSQGGAY